jgi:hypothetical protein
LAIGFNYLNTSICEYYKINAPSVLFSNGIFGILYLLCFIIFAFTYPFDLQNSMYKNLSKTHYIFKIITIVYSVILILFMILEIVILDKCTNLHQHIKAGLWIGVLHTCSGIIYVIIQMFSCILC